MSVILNLIALTGCSNCNVPLFYKMHYQLKAHLYLLLVPSYVANMWLNIVCSLATKRCVKQTRSKTKVLGSLAGALVFILTRSGNIFEGLLHPFGHGPVTISHLPSNARSFALQIGNCLGLDR